MPHLLFSSHPLACIACATVCAAVLRHAETWILTKKMMREGAQRVAFTVPIFEPLPSQYYVRVVSDQASAARRALLRRG